MPIFFLRYSAVRHGKGHALKLLTKVVKKRKRPTMEPRSLKELQALSLREQLESANNIYSQKGKINVNFLNT